MSISREDFEAGRIDLSDVRGRGKPIGPIHPGEILQEEFLGPMKITAYRLAKDIRVPLNRITAVLAGTRGITADTAMRLGRYFGTSAGLWMNLQGRYDLETARLELGAQIANEVTPIAA